MGMPPKAQRNRSVTEHHGHKIEDPYSWVRDEQWHQVLQQPEAMQAEIRDYLEAENNWTDKVLMPISDVLEELVEELEARIKKDDSTIPTLDGDWAYYRRFVSTGQYPILCRRPSSDIDGMHEQILLDGNAEAEGHQFFGIGGAVHSPDHRLFAVALDYNGSEYCTIAIRDLDTGDMLGEKIGNAQGDMAWSADSEMLFYTLLDDQHRPSKVMRHTVGTEPAEDALIYEERDPGFFLRVNKTESGRFIVISAHDHADTSEVRLIPANNCGNAPCLLKTRRTGITHDVSDDGENLILRTNLDAVDFRIVTVPFTKPLSSDWHEIVSHVEGRLIRSMLLFKSWLVRLEQSAALPRIVVRSMPSGEEYPIAFDEEAYDLMLIPGYTFDSDTLRFSYSSPTTPTRVYEYNLKSRARRLLKEQEIPSGHDPASYTCRRLLARSHDGATLPITVLHAADAPLDGSAPLLLYGYGSYGYSMQSSFMPNVFSLVDRGFIYAIAHVRGGSENGYGWYLDGKLDRKKNTFLDFVNAAEHLVAENFTSVGRIVAQGRSAGGMLVGAVVNMRPDLFCGILGEVPFVDVLNTMCDETLPLTPPEWVEWGNPLQSAAAFNYIASYCPYTNVTDQAYPHVLATGGVTDPRVTYWEPAKWVAKLRHHNTADTNILLYVNMDAGHGGASGRFDRLKEVALSYGFALMVTESL